MRRVIFSLLLISLLSPISAQASSPVIRVIDAPHTNYDGTFRDNELAQSLRPEGDLGKLVFRLPNPAITYLIDAALIDEILDMADGYSFRDEEDLFGQRMAQTWLSQLRFVTAESRVIALPYGNPDEKLLRRIAPSELNFYSQYAQAKLATLLERAVVAERGWGKGSSKLSPQFIVRYTENRRLLTGLSTITSAQEVIDLRARLAQVMNPQLSKDNATYYAYNSSKEVVAVAEKLKIVPGRYQITSSSAQLPITLINNFDTASVVSVSLIPMNSRIQIENVNSVTVAPNSRQQILVPVDVIAPGTTLVLAQFINSKGQLVGEVSRLELSATIIDSRVAWFTTGAAILLLLGAIAQSVRRIRRSRK
jgi:hypothetical protein